MRQKDRKSQSVRKRRNAIMPYVRGVTDKIRRILKRYNIKTTYKQPQQVKK